MIDFYAWATPNGEKVAIMLQETRLDYRLRPIDISKQEQFNPDFLKISPNNKIPAIVDEDGPGGLSVSIFESGAILLYLAQKANQLFPQDPLRRIACTEWLMFQMASVGPMFGQLNHFLLFAPEKIAYAIDRYTNEVKRLYRVMDLHLAKMDYFAGEYTIADIAIFPWINYHERQNIDLQDFPHVQGWHQRVAERREVKAGIERLQNMVSAKV